MIQELLSHYRLSKREYYSSLRKVLSEELRDAPQTEVDEIIESAIQQMNTEEVDEFFSVLAGLAKVAAPALISLGGKAVRGLFKKKRPRRVYHRYKKKVRRYLRSKRSAMRYMLKLSNDRRFKALLAGNMLNRVTGRRIGRGYIRTYRYFRGRREYTEVSLPEFYSLLAYLNKKLGGITTGKSGVAGGLSSSMSNEAINLERAEEKYAEEALEILYGPEYEEELGYDDGMNEFDEYGEYDGHGEYDEYDEFDTLEANAFASYDDI